MPTSSMSTSSSSDKIYRTSEEESYLRDLDKKLFDLRKQGTEGDEIAKVLLAKEQGTEKYQKASEGRSLEKIFEDMENFMDKIENTDKELLKKEFSYIGKDKFMKDSLFLLNSLRNKEIILNDSQKALIERIISFGLEKYSGRFYYYASGSIMNHHNGSLDLLGRNVGVSFLAQHFDTFSQKEKEALLLQAIKKTDFVKNSYQLEESVIE